jgi:hypothetical protein
MHAPAKTGPGSSAQPAGWLCLLMGGLPQASALLQKSDHGCGTSAARAVNALPFPGLAGARGMGPNLFSSVILLMIATHLPARFLSGGRSIRSAHRCRTLYTLAGMRPLSALRAYLVARNLPSSLEATPRRQHADGLPVPHSDPTRRCSSRPWRHLLQQE